MDGKHGRKTSTDSVASRGYLSGSEGTISAARGRRSANPRLHALWLLRSGWGMEQVAGIVGVHYRTVQPWVGWYRHGGVAEVCARHGGGHGQPAWLTPEQEGVVAEEAAKGNLHHGSGCPALGGRPVRG